MGRLLGAVLLAGVMMAASATFAQTPMSPIYPTGPANLRPARPPVKEITPAPDHEASKAPAHAQTSPPEESPVATAVIPPPVEKVQPVSAEPKKPTAPDAKEATAPKSDQAVKHHKRTARHYAARRLYAPYPVGWYNGSAGANRGWVAASSARRRTHRTGNSWDGKTGAAGFPKVPAG